LALEVLITEETFNDMFKLKLKFVFGNKPVVRSLVLPFSRVVIPPVRVVISVGHYSPVSRDGYTPLPSHQWHVRMLNPNFHDCQQAHVLVILDFVFKFCNDIGVQWYYYPPCTVFLTTSHSSQFSVKSFACFSSFLAPNHRTRVSSLFH
jgi:hypothetical protein